MTETGLVLRQREKHLGNMIQLLEETHQWMRENSYGEIWARIRPVFTFLQRDLERTAKKREETEAREEMLRKKGDSSVYS